MPGDRGSQVGPPRPRRSRSTEEECRQNHWSTSVNRLGLRYGQLNLRKRGNYSAERGGSGTRRNAVGVVTGVPAKHGKDRSEITPEQNERSHIARGTIDRS